MGRIIYVGSGGIRWLGSVYNPNKIKLGFQYGIEYSMDYRYAGIVNCFGPDVVPEPLPALNAVYPDAATITYD